jgi:Potassium-transporting ATPase A subunit
MNWKQYTAALLIFNTVLFVWGFVVLSLQPVMPLNDLKRGMLFPTTIFNSVASFMTNTNLQHYSGDQHFSNFSQIFFCVANYFLSASVGFCALTAIIRLFRKDPSAGNLENAEFQLDRVAGKWADDTKRGAADVRKEIDQILQANASAPFGGLAGEKFVNVLEVNLELCKRYGVPK